ncbi:single-stranded DNA-binding protein [Streptomyces sp. NPDC002004]
MNETMVTVVGNVATRPVFRELPTGSVARFRLAVTSRHRDRASEAWVDGHTNFFTVWAWRALGTNVAASVGVGDPVIVQGRLKVKTEQREGQPWMSADIDATAVGHDLSRGTSAFRRPARSETAQAEPGFAAESGFGTEPRFEQDPPGVPETAGGGAVGVGAGAAAGASPPRRRARKSGTPEPSEAAEVAVPV